MKVDTVDLAGFLSGICHFMVVVKTADHLLSYHFTFPRDTQDSGSYLPHVVSAKVTLAH